MKTETKDCCITISREELKRMTTEVKECICFESHAYNKIFSAAELWNIQRRKKNIVQRRILL